MSTYRTNSKEVIKGAVISLREEEGVEIICEDGQVIFVTVSQIKGSQIKLVVNASKDKKIHRYATA